MMNESITSIALIVTSTLIIISILLQNKGAGISEVFGGSDGYNYRTKRGVEKILSRSTVALATLLILISLASLIF